MPNLNNKLCKNVKHHGLNMTITIKAPRRINHVANSINQNYITFTAHLTLKERKLRS